MDDLNDNAMNERSYKPRTKSSNMGIEQVLCSDRLYNGPEREESEK